MKVLVILALVGLAAVSVSAGRHQRQRQRGRALDAEISQSGAENIAAIEETLNLIHQKQQEFQGEVESLSPQAAQAASEDIQEHIADAIEIAAENPQAQEVKPQIVQEKIEDSIDDLNKYVKLAKRHQKALRDYGADMTPEEAVEHHKGVQKYLEMALHSAQQHSIAVQEDKAIEAGATHAEVAEIAPEIKAAGRRMRG